MRYIKKNLVIFLILLLSFYTGIIAMSIPDEMIQSYNEIGRLNYRWEGIDIKYYDTEIWQAKNVLVISALEGIENIIDENGRTNTNKNGEYRYLGYNPVGYLINNPDYADDNVGKEIINQYKWMKNDEMLLNIAPYISTPEDLNFYKKEIFYFLEQEYGQRFDERDDPMKWLARARVIVPVSEYGRGVIRFVHEWDSDKNGSPEEWYITVNLRAKSQVPEYKLIYEKGEETPVSYKSENIDALVDLRSNMPKNELFDADVAIPTGEQLYAQVQLREYIHNEEYIKKEGAMDFIVTVSKNYTLRRWDDEAIKIDGNGDGDFTDPVDTIQGDWLYDGPYSVSKNYIITRQYSYYSISDIGVYSLEKANIKNESLPNGAIELSGTVNEPVVELITYSEREHVIEPIQGNEKFVDLGSETIGSGNSYPAIPNEDFFSVANAAVGEFSVRNDKFVFNEVEILSDKLVDTQTAAPLSIPQAPLCDPSVFLKTKLVIPDTVKNGSYSTTGLTTYIATAISVKGSSNDITVQTGKKEIPVNSLETVVVHTPVVCNPMLNQISKASQQILLSDQFQQLVLEETFHIDYPTHGTHITSKGYATRDYNAYTQVRQVQFPFDVYVGENYSGLYLPKNTWGNFNSLERTFFIPSWAMEGQGHILFRTIPKNIPSIDDPNYEFNANLSRQNYKAVEATAYNLSGKVESFTITDCRDDAWLSFFSQKNQSSTSNKIDQLPLLPGTKYTDSKGKQQQLNGVMLGYPVSFSIRTNGDLNDSKDFIYIKPRFSFVPEVNGVIDMSRRQEVDLYQGSYSTMTKIDKSFALSENQRSFIGNTSLATVGISSNEKAASVQQWEGKFFLPNMTYCVPKGTDLASYKYIDVSKAPFLRNGYIVVNFDIFVYNNLESITKPILMDSVKLDALLRQTVSLQTRKEQNLAEYLRYGNGWIEDGFQTSQHGLSLQAGDILFYSTELRASQTYY